MSCKKAVWCCVLCPAFFGVRSVYSQTRLIQAISTKSFGFLPLFVAQESGFNAASAGRKTDEVKISEVADLRLLREVQHGLGIRCEGGYECGK